MSMPSYTPVTVNTDHWINPMQERLYQVWAETREDKNLIPVSPAIGKQQAENFYDIYKKQIKKGLDKVFGDVHLMPVEDDTPKLLLPSDPRQSIEYLRHKFSQERHRMNYNRSNPFWR